MQITVVNKYLHYASLKASIKTHNRLVLQAFSVPRHEICEAREFSGRESSLSNVINILGRTASTRGVVRGFGEEGGSGFDVQT